MMVLTATRLDTCKGKLDRTRFAAVSKSVYWWVESEGKDKETIFST